MVTESLEQQSAAFTEHWSAEIERAVRQRDSDVFFVLPRILRRILRHELDITSPWVRVPHRKSYVIDRDRLSWLVAIDELGVGAGTELPHRAMLIARPEEDRLKRFSPDELRLYYWRMHFHARIDLTMTERTAADRMTAAQLRRRIDRLGQQQFDEVRLVLRQEAMLTDPDDLRHVYSEFVAVFHELRAFAPDLLPLYFPSLSDVDDVAETLRDDVDAAMLLDYCRPTELAGVDPAAFGQPVPSTELSAAELPAPSAPRSQRWYRGLSRAAEGFRNRGNVVRAAMIRRRALAAASAEDAPEAEAELRAELQTLARRLQAALELDDDETAAWQRIFFPLVTGSVRGYWNANTRLLYDLQKVCLDHEQETYRVDLVRWIRTLGKHPLRRPLPQLRAVLIAKHLRIATRRIPAVRIDPEGRSELVDLLHRAAEQAEAILRARLQPQIGQAFADVGVVPADVVERVALHKLSAELLDVVVQRGFLTLGNLRDAFSRSQWKLPDLADAQEFAYGDALLRADQRFAVELDGVYQKGPFYLRWLQRMTSLFFGTPYGRILTQYVALPFGGAYVILAGLHHLDELAVANLGTPELHILGHDPWEKTLRTAALGLVLFALIHWPLARRFAWSLLWWNWWLVKSLVVDLPRALHKLPPVAWIMRSLPALIFRRYILSPLLVTLLLWQGLPLLGVSQVKSRWWALAILVLSFAVLNSRLGRDSEELLWEWLGKAWHRFRVTVIIGLFNLIVDLFRQVMDAVERVLYSVDEWLRFRSGESDFTLGVKAVLGAVWSVVNAVVPVLRDAAYRAAGEPD